MLFDIFFVITESIQAGSNVLQEKKKAAGYWNIELGVCIRYEDIKLLFG